MNITPLTIYFWQLADRISPCFLTFSILFGIASIILMIIHACWCADLSDYKAKKKNNSERENYWDDDIAKHETLVKWTAKWKLFLPVSIVLGFLSALSPCSNTIAMMVVIPEIAKSKMMQQDLPDIYNAAVQALKDQLQKK